MKLARLVYLLLPVFVLGCSSNLQQTQYYLLPYQSLGSSQTPDVEIEINLAEYLKQDFIVIENQASELSFAHHHRWAEPLELMLKRYLSKQILAGAEGAARIPQIEINIERFYGSVSGEVYLSGYWQSREQGDEPVERTYFDLKAHQQEAGYRAFVATSADLLSQLAAQMNRQGHLSD